ncbi:hypothetical protein RclHR1_01000028 [Rhizophagus clarus]|uniref:Uncharacterized protein n=1 Tax=Rhizophagus clarus TaxID=94130 RepID=A0A2Z6Q548_9GLOM|nr:hypothetical protein RclHR1_01000028 [Rhizophagus clarus]
MLIPTEDIIQQQNFEQLCESIKHLDIQQQSRVNDIINNNKQQHYPTAQVNLPSINELIDYQTLIIRIGELERTISLQSQEIENLRKEYSELNEKLSLLVQVEVNVQLESKFNYLKQEFNNYKEELNEKFSRYNNNNDMKVVNHFFDPNNNNNSNNSNNYQINRDDHNVVFGDISNTFNNFESNSQMGFNHSQRNEFSFNNDFGNIHMELQSVANELINDRDSFAERMNSLRNMFNNQSNY